MKQELIDINHVLGSYDGLIEDLKSIKAIQTTSDFHRATINIEKINGYADLLLLLRRGMKPCESNDILGNAIDELLNQNTLIQQLIQQYLNK